MTDLMSMQPVPPSRRESTDGHKKSPRPFVLEPLPNESVETEHRWYLPCKAGLEFVIALGLLVLAAPLVVLGALLVKLTSRGPAFYCQARLGKDGREFTLFKLRTMIKDAEMLTGPVWADRDDQRLTPVGRILRSAHIDELPQLLNVLLGQMSLVGPRPERPELVPRLESELPHYGDRVKIRPGMTDMAQLRLPPDLTLECVRRKLVYDLYYVRYVNPWLDARIILLTFARLFVDALKTAGRPFGLPPWEIVTQHVPAAVNAEFDGADTDDGDSSGDGRGATSEHALIKKPR